MAPYQLSAEEGKKEGFYTGSKGKIAGEGVVTRNDEAFLAREQET